jgi:hypothetical protein
VHRLEDIIDNEFKQDKKHRFGRIQIKMKSKFTNSGSQPFCSTVFSSFSPLPIIRSTSFQPTNFLNKNTTKNQTNYTSTNDASINSSVVPSFDPSITASESPSLVPS